MGTRRKYAHKTLNPLEMMFRYKWSAKGGIIPGQDDTVVKYKGNTKTKTRMVPASWSLVITIALVNAFAIQFARQAWFAAYGKPDFFRINPDLEEAYAGHPGLNKPIYDLSRDVSAVEEPSDLREQIQQLREGLAAENPEKAAEEEEDLTRLHENELSPASE